jgi:hypothetical protein
MVLDGIIKEPLADFLADALFPWLEPFGNPPLFEPGRKDSGIGQ